MSGVRLLLLFVLSVDGPLGRGRHLTAPSARMIDAVDKASSKEGRADDLGCRQQTHALNGVEHRVISAPRLTLGRRAGSSGDDAHHGAPACKPESGPTRMPDGNR